MAKDSSDIALTTDLYYFVMNLSIYVEIKMSVT